MFFWLFFFCKQKTAYDMRISDWSSDVCSSDLWRCRSCPAPLPGERTAGGRQDEVPVVVRIAAVAGLRGLDDVVDLAGGHVVQDVALAVVVPVLEVAEHGIDLRPEHDAGLGFRRAVGVDLDEAPFRPALDVDSSVAPAVDARRGGRVVGADVGVLAARDDAVPAVAPVQPDSATAQPKSAPARGAPP